MIFVKIFLLINLLLMVMIYSIHGQIPPGSNAYLPPKQTGYSYPGPPRPFKPPSPGPTPGPGPGQGPRPTSGQKPAPGQRPAPGPGQRRVPGPGPRPTPGFRPGPIGPPGQRPPPRGEPGPGHVHVPGMPFDFQYAVNDIATSNDYNHKAASNGDEVKGEYRVQLPDGRMQVVRYTADWKTGYHADVSYEGQLRSFQGPSGPRPGGGGAGGGGYKY